MRREPSRSSWKLAAGAAALLVCAPGAPATAVSPADSAAGRKLAQRMIEAHGGMDAWQKAPSVRFEDRFQPSEGEGFSTTIVEQGSRRACIDMPESGARMAWDGEKAWSLNWKSGAPPRFMALLNYYFLNLPWLTQDPGVVLGEPGKAKLRDETIEYTTLRMTFEDGIGDTPKDYYELYIHPETHRLRACEYIVTYRSLLPPGVDATPPHILVFDEFTTVSGLLVPTSYTIYDGDKVYASCEIRNWSFTQPFDAKRVAMPAGAVLDESKP